MKGSLATAALLAVLVAAFLLAACGDGSTAPTPTPPQPTLTIVVTGTKGLEYEGRWKAVGLGGSGEMGIQTFLPETPPLSQTYEVTGTIISLRFEKRQREGRLRVELREQDRVLVRLETDEPFGAVLFGQ